MAANLCPPLIIQRAGKIRLRLKSNVNISRVHSRVITNGSRRASSSKVSSQGRSKASSHRASSQGRSKANSRRVSSQGRNRANSRRVSSIHTIRDLNKVRNRDIAKGRSRGLPGYATTGLTVRTHSPRKMPVPCSIRSIPHAIRASSAHSSRLNRSQGHSHSRDSK